MINQEKKPTAKDAQAPPDQRSRWGSLGVLVGGQGASLIGDQIFFIAIAWAAVQLGGAAAVTVVTLAGAIPRALMLVLGGAICDAIGPRIVLLRSTTGRVVMLAIAAAAAMTVDSIWLLIAIAVIEGALLGLAAPSFQTMLPRLVVSDQLARANSLYVMVARIAPIVGGPAGAWLIATGHLSVALVCVALTCAVSLGCLTYVTRGVERPAGEAGNLLKRSGDGFALLRRDRRLRLLFIASFCMDLSFAWPMNPALPLLMSERGWGVGAAGTVIAAFGIGALASAGLGALIAHRVPVFIRVVVCGLGIASGLVAMVLVPSLLTMSAVAMAVGVLAGQTGPALVTLYQQAAPTERMGSAMSMISLGGIGTLPFSFAIFGAIAVFAGVTNTWIVCGLLAFCSPIVGILALRAPAGAREPVQTQESADVHNTAGVK